MTTFKFVESYDDHAVGQEAEIFDPSSTLAGAVYAPTSGRFGGGCITLQNGDEARIDYDGTVEGIIGFSFYYDYADFSSGGDLLQALSAAGNVHARLAIGSDGRLEIRDPSNNLLGAGPALVVGTWYHIEARLYIDNDYGYMVVRLNKGPDQKSAACYATNKSLISPSGGDLKYFALLGFGSGTVRIDDTVAINATGNDINSGFWGDGKFVTLRMEDDGNYSEWTNGDYSDIAEAPVNDSTYLDSNDSAGGGPYSEFIMEDMDAIDEDAEIKLLFRRVRAHFPGGQPSPGDQTSVNNVLICSFVDIDDFPNTIKAQWYVVPDDFTLLNAYRQLFPGVGNFERFETDFDGDPWTVETINALDISISVVTSPTVDYIHVSYISVSVWVTIAHGGADGDGGAPGTADFGQAQGGLSYRYRPA